MLFRLGAFRRIYLYSIEKEDEERLIRYVGFNSQQLPTNCRFTGMSPTHAALNSDFGGTVTKVTLRNLALWNFRWPTNPQQLVISICNATKLSWST